MGLLGALFAGVKAGLGGQVARAEFRLDVVAAGGHGVAAEIGRVGAHVGDVARLVEPLRQGHGPLDAVAQPATGGLLQGGGDQRRVGTGLGGPFGAVADLEGALPKPAKGVLRSRLIAGAERLAVLLDHLEAQRLRVFLALEVGEQLPILLGLEGPNLPLPLHHQPHRHRLHPPRRQPPGHLGPKQRRQFEAHHAVEEAARLLGVDPVHVQFAGRAEGVLNGLAGDLVEDHPPVAVSAPADGLAQVPGDGLAFAVQVGGQVNRIRPRRQARQLLDHLLLAGQHFVVRPPLIVPDRPPCAAPTAPAPGAPAGRPARGPTVWPLWSPRRAAGRRRSWHPCRKAGRGCGRRWT